jgi:hypothetical protein
MTTTIPAPAGTFREWPHGRSVAYVCAALDRLDAEACERESAVPEDSRAAFLRRQIATGQEALKPYLGPGLRITDDKASALAFQRQSQALDHAAGACGSSERAGCTSAFVWRPEYDREAGAWFVAVLTDAGRFSDLEGWLTR